MLSESNRRNNLSSMIPSFGLIVYCSKTRRILLYSRRDSIAYVMLIRCGWKDVQTALRLLPYLTDEERNRIRLYSYEELSADLSVVERPINKIGVEKWKELIADDRFTKTLNEGIFSPGANWGFPKGRISSGETPLATALREFTEETTLCLPLTILRSSLFEKFEGTDGRMYSTKYFLALTSEEKIPVIRKLPGKRIRTTTLSSEASDVEWADRDSALQKLSPDHVILFDKAQSIFRKYGSPRRLLRTPPSQLPGTRC